MFAAEWQKQHEYWRNKLEVYSYHQVCVCFSGLATLLAVRNLLGKLHSPLFIIYSITISWTDSQLKTLYHCHRLQLVLPVPYCTRSNYTADSPMSIGNNCHCILQNIRTEQSKVQTGFTICRTKYQYCWNIRKTVNNNTVAKDQISLFQLQLPVCTNYDGPSINVSSQSYYISAK